jgi:hypothetical protein
VTPRLVLALSATLFAAQAPFEGKLRMRTIEVTLDDSTLAQSLLDVSPATLLARDGAVVESATVLIRNNVIRTEAAAAEDMDRNDPADVAYGLWDLNRNALVLVDPSKRQYVEFTLDDLAAHAGPEPRRSRPAAMPVKALGRSRTINGMKTTAYEVRTPDLIVRAWMTQDYPGLSGTFLAAINRSQDEDDDDEDDDPEEAAAAALAGHGFPVLMIVLTPGSIDIQETLSVDRAPLGAHLFQVPAGYTKRSLLGEP